MNSSLHWWGLVVGILGALTVILGAFGAHWLSDKLTATAMDNYKTAVLYQFIHVLAATIAVALMYQLNESYISYAYIAFTGGIIFFCGSLYLLSLRELLNIEAWSKILGPITPLGGLLFILGWIFLAIGLFKSLRI